ncbi:MAG: TOBE domain-containing protein [Clostridiales bacterium]|nr:TOBE domain-containing protein [Clostridiales bacterium]
MNFFNDAKLIVKKGKYYAQIKGTDFELSELHQKALRANNQQPCDIVAGIRPEHVTLGEGGLSASAEVCEMMGSSLHLHTDCNGDEVVLVVSTVGLDQGLIDGSTKTVHFTFPADLLQLFDKQTGNNLVWFDPESAAANAPVCKKY